MKRLTPKLLDELLDELQVKFINGDIKAKVFDMNSFTSSFCDFDGGNCKTVHCIGGWLSELAMAHWPEEVVETSGHDYIGPIYGYMEVSKSLTKRLVRLFEPSAEACESNDLQSNEFGEYDWKKYKRKHAVRAIQNFRDGAKDPWMNVIPEVKAGKEG